MDISKSPWASLNAASLTFRIGLDISRATQKDIATDILTEIIITKTIIYIISLLLSVRDLDTSFPICLLRSASFWAAFIALLRIGLAWFLNMSNASSLWFLSPISTTWDRISIYLGSSWSITAISDCSSGVWQFIFRASRDCCIFWSICSSSLREFCISFSSVRSTISLTTAEPLLRYVSNEPISPWLNPFSTRALL